MACGIWPLSHRWGVGVRCELRPMPFKEKVLVRSLTFTIELYGCDVGAFTSEVEAKAVKMIRKYPIKIEVAKS